ncbi:MAG: hypothetical protein ACM3XM_03155 [Mycobacterium leprae]
MLDAKADLRAACRRRNMKLTERPVNLLESRLKAEGILDGMDVRIDLNCINGMPAESQGSITLQGNVTQLLSVLARVWPMPAETWEAESPGRQNWPDHQHPGKPKKRKASSSQHPEGD